jgi:flagellar biosynthesis component FlhA
VSRSKIKKALLLSRQDAACSAAVAIALGIVIGLPWQDWLLMAVALAVGAVGYNLWLVRHPHVQARRVAKRTARRSRRTASRTR